MINGIMTIKQAECDHPEQVIQKASPPVSSEGSTNPHSGSTGSSGLLCCISQLKLDQRVTVWSQCVNQLKLCTHLNPERVIIIKNWPRTERTMFLTYLCQCPQTEHFSRIWKTSKMTAV